MLMYVQDLAIKHGVGCRQAHASHEWLGYHCEYKVNGVRVYTKERKPFPSRAPTKAEKAELFSVLQERFCEAFAQAYIDQVDQYWKNHLTIGEER